jgi:hypothetical protein
VNASSSLLAKGGERLQMLYDLDEGYEGGDLIYVTGFMPKGGSRFSRLCLISVLYLYIIL